MNTAQKPKITIVGAGLGGALLANYLGQAGFKVAVYERRADIRTAEIVTGRSINLALSTRGIHALTEVGVIDQVMREAIPMPGRMIHSLGGELSFQPYGRDGQAINSVSRAGLNIILLDAAQKYPNVALHFQQKCVDLDPDTASVELEHGETHQRSTVPADLVIGCDGAFSAVRHRMQRLDRFNYSIDYLEHGYKELIIPPADDGGFRMEKNALHIWPRRSYMMIALPNADGSYTVTCFWPLEGAHSFANLETDQDVTRCFERQFPDAVPLMPTLTRDYFASPVGTLATVRCSPWHYRDKVALLGDAAHAIVPFYGQGMIAAFEDCTVLHECLTGGGSDRGEALATYHRLRKENCDAIADLALGNFIEMRDHVGSPAFLRKKKREKRLHRLLGSRYVPLYTMVSFTRTPYAEVVRRAKAQDRFIARLTAAGLCALVLLVLLVCWILL
ncbi:MAG: FAD-dependent monooxygenase [Planctomycetes bacterium]|nr:FAD-dependent monooxygenase [Planctomycetota bacterium]